MAICFSKHQLEKKLAQFVKSDNEDVQDLTSNKEENNYSFPNSGSCWVCNGYYGPNFDEPLCGVCHAFLYNTQSVEELGTAVSDDDDSGNDEPPFKDKQEADEDDEDGEEVGILKAEPENYSINLTGIAVEEAPFQNIDYEICHSSGKDTDKGSQILLPIQRPPPLAPRSLPDFLELLSEARVHERCSSLWPPNNILLLPVEIMVIIFSYLDDMSMWKASEVCKEWRSILEQNTSQIMWMRYLKERWPLFQSIVDVPNWLKLYSALMNSCFCRTCLLQMALTTPPRARQNAIRMNFLSNEAYQLNNHSTEGIDAVPLDKQNTYWQASILGPAGSPYEGGKFFIYIFFPERYPMIPPTVRFLTKILHPNVSRHGDVGIDIFQHNWSLALNVSKILLSVQSLLTDPYTEVCMEPELGHIYEQNRAQFDNLARSWTWKYAMYELLPPIN